MTTRAPSTVPVPPWGLAVAAILSVQLGSALLVDLISTVGPAGTAWLRLSMGALIFLILARPPLRVVRPRDVPALLGLGITTGLVTIAFLAAIARIPLGTAVAIEFLGPWAVAAVRSHTARALVWLAVALLGVVLLTEPWHGDIDPAGIALAGLAAVGWASYILLTQRIGDRFTGSGALSITVTIAAATAAVIGIPEATGHLTLGILAAAAGLSILLPVLPFACELLALHQMTPTAFGTLMALEPAIGVLLVLHQQPSTIQFVGILLVVLAGAAAQYGGRRRPRATERINTPTDLDCIGDAAPGVCVVAQRVPIGAPLTGQGVRRFASMRGATPIGDEALDLVEAQHTVAGHDDAARTRVVRHRSPQVPRTRPGDRVPTQEAVDPTRLEPGGNWR